MAAAGGAGSSEPKYKLPPLPYEYDALDPYGIDTATMRVHHLGHHQGYTDKLNQAITQLASTQPDLAALPIEKLLQNLDKITDAKLRTAIRNSGGGYVNHIHFWSWMAPSAGGPATGGIGAAIDAAFGSFDKFKEEFSAAAAAVFGSGWAWLVLDTTEGTPKLKVVATPNQDNPSFKEGVHLLLGLDVWEHAYYLKYQNKRAAYIEAWWGVVNWSYVNKLYDAATGKTA